jgi:hypothetical protein
MGLLKNIAAENDRLHVVSCLGQELGIDVNKANQNGTTPLCIAAQIGRLDVVKCLVKELGVDVHQANNGGATPLIIAGYQGHLGVVQWLLAEAPSMDDIHGPQGHTLWNTLELEDAVDTELTSLLKVMVFLADVPPEFITKLSPQKAKLWEQDRQFRLQLPAYLVQQRASIVAACPLPGVLQPIVAEYVAPTSDDMWTYGLRV